MKKVILTVIATVGFSMFASANTIDNIETSRSRDCDQEGINARDCAYSVGNITWAQAEQIGDCVTEKCLEETKQAKSLSTN